MYWKTKREKERYEEPWGTRHSVAYFWYTWEDESSWEKASTPCEDIEPYSQ
jgi:hypothetical protein